MNGDGNRSWLSSRVEVEDTVPRINVVELFRVVQETENSQWEVTGFFFSKSTSRMNETFNYG